jgi:hypothetical protein
MPNPCLRIAGMAQCRSADAVQRSAAQRSAAQRGAAQPLQQAEG